MLPGGCGSTSCPLVIPGCSNPGCLGGECPGPGPGIGETNGEGDDNPTTSTYFPWLFKVANAFKVML